MWAMCSLPVFQDAVLNYTKKMAICVIYVNSPYCEQSLQVLELLVKKDLCIAPFCH